MASCAQVTVSETDAATWAGILASAATPEQIAAGGFWLFEVKHNAKRAGGFLVENLPTGARLHTELAGLPGKATLAAIRELFRILKDRYNVSRITTYTEPGNARARMMAAAAGFRRVAQDERGTHFERWLRT